MAALEALWRQELVHERLTVASDSPVEHGKRISVRLEMPGPHLWLAGTVRSVRPVGGRFAVELQLTLQGAQLDTLRKLADF